jgi:hypothetical protein
VPYQSVPKRRKKHLPGPKNIIPPPVWEENRETVFGVSPQNEENGKDGGFLFAPNEPTLVTAPPVSEEGVSVEFTTDDDILASLTGSSSLHDNKIIRPEEIPPEWTHSRPKRQPISTLLAVGLCTSIVFFALGVLFGVFLVSPDSLDTAKNLSKPSYSTQNDILVFGKLTYTDNNGRTQNDEGATVLFLPEKAPDKRISPKGISVRDSMPTLAHPHFAQLIRIGGYYLRTDSQGEFLAKIGKAGKYHVLMISAHAERLPDSPIDETAKDVLKKFFTDPALLIAEAKSLLMEAEIQRGFPPLNQDFGASEKDIESLFQ